MNPENFKQMIIEIRQVEKAIGSISYDVSNSAKQSLNGRRSLYIFKEIKKGEQLSTDNIKCIRPAHGLAPKYYELVLGKKVLKDLYPGDRLSLDLIE
jgi:sialic acid synthase SpsE